MFYVTSSARALEYTDYIFAVGWDSHNNSAGGDNKSFGAEVLSKRFGECGVLFKCHYIQVHFDPVS